MRFFLKNIILLIFLLPQSSFSKNSFHITKWHEEITAIPQQDRYLSHVICRGTNSEKSSTVFIPYYELDRIDSIHVRFSDRENKISNLDTSKINNRSVTAGTFYENLRVYQFDIPATSEFSYTYLRISADLMRLSCLELNPELNRDTTEFILTIPKGYVLLYKLCNIDSTLSVRIDSTIEKNCIRYVLRSVNHCGEVTDEMRWRNNVPMFLKKIPAIETIVIPEHEKSHPEEYFNKWFTHILSGVPGLSKKNFRSISAEIKATGDTDLLIKNIFHFVQSKIKYIDIENGRNAYVPRNPDFVFDNKQGDCKDMAFITCSILKGFGITSYLALSASITYPFDMDFPSIASANHCICTVKRNNRWIFLDATDNVCEYGLPSNQIQGKHVFITGKETAEYAYIPPVDTAATACTFQLSFHVGERMTDGKFAYEFKHSGANMYKMFYASANSSDFNLFLHGMLKDLAVGCEHENIRTDQTDSTILFSGDLRMSHNIFNSYSSQVYLPIDFMPYLDGLPKTYKISDPVICYSTLNKKGILSLLFDKPVHLKNSRTKTFSENGFEFTLSISQEDSKKITVHSSLTYNDVTINKEQLPSYRKMILFITAELNKGIIYE